MSVAFVESIEPRHLFASHGLSATYFDRTDFTAATVTRIDSKVSFDFSNHAHPAAGIHGDTYSIRWSGLLRAPVTERFKFRVRHDDGARLWVNGRLLVDRWTDAGDARIDTGTISLRAGHYYDLRLEYLGGADPAGIRLEWLSASTPHAVVPASRLFAYDTRFAAIGDFGRTTDYAQGTARIVNGWNPDYVITVGDNNYTSDGYDENVGTYYHQYIGDYSGSHGAGSATNRFWPALGNHDWDTPQAYFDFFTLPGNERYYDFVQGDIHFFVLDSDPREPDGDGPDSAQGHWLQNALAGSDSLYNIVYFHHAPFSSGMHGGTGAMRWPFKAWGADAVLSGHDHDYERLIEDGLPYFVNGCGAGPRSIGSPVAGSLFRDDSDSGALLIEANDQFITFQYELRSGQLIDTFTMKRT